MRGEFSSERLISLFDIPVAKSKRCGVKRVEMEINGRAGLIFSGSSCPSWHDI